MPIHSGKENGKCYYQWGNHGKKYYYKCNSPLSKKRAKAKAKAQAIAIYASGWKGE